ncbi:SIS domain-containing protein, partial [Burkholderia contaminans]
LAVPRRRPPAPVISRRLGETAPGAGGRQRAEVRVWRALGGHGLAEDKVKLESDLAGTIPMSDSQVHLGDTATDFGAKVLDNTVSAILQLREHLNFEHVENAIEILNGARRIEFYGLGNSNIVAQDAHYKFFRFGIPTIAYGDLYMQAASAALLGKGDVVVAVSKSGRAAAPLRVPDRAVQGGASG